MSGAVQLVHEQQTVTQTTTKAVLPDAGLVVTFYPYEPEHDTPHFVHVDRRLALAADPRLAELDAREAALGELRWCPRVEYGGCNPEVDALYDEMNTRRLDAYHAVAVRAVRLLADAGVVTGDVTRAIDGARGNAYAGCETCTCSPGVTLGAPLYAEVGGYERKVLLFIDPITAANEG